MKKEPNYARWISSFTHPSIDVSIKEVSRNV